MRALTLGLVVLALSPAALTAQKLKVFVLAGQSNMQGHGRISMGKDGDLDFTAEQERFAWLKDRQGDWVERDDVWYFHKNGKGEITAGNLRPGLGANESSVGPELAFGHALGEHFDEQVLLIKTAWGGQALAHTFRPPSAGLPSDEILDRMVANANKPRKNKPAPDPAVTREDIEAQFGSKYRQMLDEVQMVLGDLREHFPSYRGGKRGYEIAGLLWHQGWNDGCSKDWSAEYEPNMVHFIADVRRDLEIPDLPVVIATSGMGGPKATGVAGFLAKGIEPKQVAAAEASERCLAVPTRHFQLHQPGRQKSHWFNSAESYCLVGDASATAMLTLLADD